MIDVIYCPVDKGPMRAWVSGTVNDLKGLVGGEVELLHVLPGIMVAVNEHYIELGLPYNRWIHRGAYNGPVVFVGSPRRGKPYRMITPREMIALCDAGFLDINEFISVEAVYGADCI